jgi:hypothetical protein
MKYIKLLGVAAGTVYAAEFAEGLDFVKKADADAKASNPTMTGHSVTGYAVKYGAGAVALVILHRVLLGGK